MAFAPAACATALPAPRQGRRPAAGAHCCLRFFLPLVLRHRGGAAARARGACSTTARPCRASCCACPASPRIDPQLVTADEGQHARHCCAARSWPALSRVISSVTRCARATSPCRCACQRRLPSPANRQYGLPKPWHRLRRRRTAPPAGRWAKRVAGQRQPAPLQPQPLALFNPTEGYGSFVVSAVAILILQQPCSWAAPCSSARCASRHAGGGVRTAFGAAGAVPAGLAGGAVLYMGGGLSGRATCTAPTRWGALAHAGRCLCPPWQAARP